MVGRWVRMQYGLRSAVTAVFMLHAVVNANPMVRTSRTKPIFAHDGPERSCNPMFRTWMLSEPLPAFRSR